MSLIKSSLSLICPSISWIYPFNYVITALDLSFSSLIPLRFYYVCLIISSRLSLSFFRTSLSSFTTYPLASDSVSCFTSFYLVISSACYFCTFSSTKSNNWFLSALSFFFLSLLTYCMFILQVLFIVKCLVLLLIEFLLKPRNQLLLLALRESLQFVEAFDQFSVVSA